MEKNKEKCIEEIRKLAEKDTILNKMTLNRSSL